MRFLKGFVFTFSFLILSAFLVFQYIDYKKADIAASVLEKYGVDRGIIEDLGITEIIEEIKPQDIAQILQDKDKLMNNEQIREVYKQYQETGTVNKQQIQDIWNQYKSGNLSNASLGSYDSSENVEIPEGLEEEVKNRIQSSGISSELNQHGINEEAVNKALNQQN